MTDQLCIITPCFNPGRFLLPCLESVAAQAQTVKRHVVMDGGSTDGSVEVLAEFAKSHPGLFWQSQHDKGQSDALNKALALVDTPFVGWLNADDCYVPGGLTVLLKAIESLASSSVGIVYGDYKIIDGGGKTIRLRRQPSFCYWDCLYGYLTVQNAAAIFNTDLLRQAGGFDVNLQFCMDYDVVLKLALRGRVIHVREYVGLFRHHDSAKTATLQDVCSEETKMLRMRYSNCSDLKLKNRYWLSKARIITRMALEGCLPSRFGIESE